MDQTGLKTETIGSEVNNIVEFVENNLGIKLRDYQKELITKTYEAYKKDEKLHIRGMTRRTSLVPMAIRQVFEKYEESKNGEDTRIQKS